MSRCAEAHNLNGSKTVDVAGPSNPRPSAKATAGIGSADESTAKSVKTPSQERHRTGTPARTSACMPGE
eukprot:CAMPEP_0185189600 /NCGR_PEP_ID=MMETSP1140-20130426/6140_1 /TAXON_ID=298111 /ORGANISM="Pavlova sp., Strain CCMP459" /LENGTH=68 /DNA_ID=CAMNT_0027756177 /DNA_START=627 /DNA_END=833 /DNA_ORIENTATION=+